MNDNDQTTQNERSRSFSQEMRQTFTDWVNKLPFIKKDITRDLEREQLEEESVEQAPDLHRTGSALPGPSLDDKGRN